MPRCMAIQPCATTKAHNDPALQAMVRHCKPASPVTLRHPHRELGGVRGEWETYPISYDNLVYKEELWALAGRPDVSLLLLLWLVSRLKSRYAHLLPVAISPVLMIVIAPPFATPSLLPETQRPCHTSSARGSCYRFQNLEWFCKWWNALYLL